MKKIIIGLALLVTACAHTQPDTGLARGPELPNLPPSLSHRYGQLPPLTDPSMGAQQIDAAATDGLYNSAAHQANTLVDLWNCAQQALKNKTDPKLCINKIGF